MVEKVDGKVKEIEQRRDLKQAIYGPNAKLGDDDVMTSNDPGAVFALTWLRIIGTCEIFRRGTKKLDDL